jgi:hypothetical protein
MWLSSNYSLFQAKHGVLQADESIEMVAMSREIPQDALYGIVTPSGYYRLGRNGRPALRRGSNGLFSLSGVYPYATPALWTSDAHVVVAQYNSTGDSGVFTVRTAAVVRVLFEL